MTTNYFQTFITVSPDSKAKVSAVPSKAGSIAALQHALLSADPYRFTSDDLLFEVHAQRKEIPEADRESERAAFFSRSQACLRTSPLVKQFGWGIHHDDKGKVAAYGVESEAYRKLSQKLGVKCVAGIRSKKA